ncbi:MAG: sigma-54-dependent Fis family transcriptional regulator [Desulfobacterium sp.]|nr:sigma-54-dependent Fis family transcriptional regulator [Desulfobacterium sp.]
MTEQPNMINILVVDDEKSIRRLLEKELTSSRRSITTAGNAKEALAAIRKDVFDVIVLDISLPDANGIELMSRFQEEILAIQIILITGYGDVDDAVEAMKTGACDYITKPFDLGRLEQVVEKAYQRGCLHRQAFLKSQGDRTNRNYPEQIVGHSAAMEEVRFLIGKVAPTSVPVLITGESGSGKSVFARQLHGLSLRGDNPLITKNCATLQEELIRSELFGYCKGAFTGAEESRNGLLALADQGTLFLDEIGELTVGVQASLLRVMENQTFRPVGDKNEIKVDIRFIFATNRDLKEEVAKGRFSEALFHRLNVFSIKILPLRKRKEEIPVLVEYFLGKMSFGTMPHTVSKNAMERLMAYDWPGNVRELHNVMERGVILAENNAITERCLPLELLETADGNDGVPAPLFTTLEDLEKNHILKVIKHVDGNRSKAAEILGISRKTLYRKLLDNGS